MLRVYSLSVEYKKLRVQLVRICTLLYSKEPLSRYSPFARGYNSMFDKGYLVNWTKEYFRITKIYITALTVYKLCDKQCKVLESTVLLSRAANLTRDM